jgi:hypothetical protein
LLTRQPLLQTSVAELVHRACLPQHPAPVGILQARHQSQRSASAQRQLLTTADYAGDRTWFAPDEVRLVIEVV